MAIRTGADYIKALRDGREVWHAGRRIDDVTGHAGFTGTIKTLADLYDKQHAPECRDIMTLDYEGERIAYSYLPPRNAQELALKRRNIEFWSQATFGQMGRFQTSSVPLGPARTCRVLRLRAPDSPFVPTLRSLDDHNSSSTRATAALASAPNGG